jgi:hypothetical protein
LSGRLARRVKVKPRVRAVACGEPSGQARGQALDPPREPAICSAIEVKGQECMEVHLSDGGTHCGGMGRVKLREATAEGGLSLTRTIPP